jgi:hypothetical protein
MPAGLILHVGTLSNLQSHRICTRSKVFGKICPTQDENQSNAGPVEHGKCSEVGKSKIDGGGRLTFLAEVMIREEQRRGGRGRTREGEDGNNRGGQQQQGSFLQQSSGN